MKRRLRNATTVAGVVLAATTALPFQAAYANHILTVCDNADTSGTVLYRAVPLPGGIGVVEIHLGAAQDSWMSYNGPGTPFDTLAGVDGGSVSLNEGMTVCLRAPLVGSYTATVNVVGLDLEVCSWSGEPGHGAVATCTKIL